MNIWQKNITLIEEQVIETWKWRTWTNTFSFSKFFWSISNISKQDSAQQQ